MNLTASDIIAILGAVFGGLTTMLTLWLNFKSGKILETAQKSVGQNREQLSKLDEVHKDINGRVAETIAVKEQVREQVEGAAIAAARIIDTAKALKDKAKEEE